MRSWIFQIYRVCFKMVMEVVKIYLVGGGCKDRVIVNVFIMRWIYTINVMQVKYLDNRIILEKLSKVDRFLNCCIELYVIRYKLKTHWCKTMCNISVDNTCFTKNITTALFSLYIFKLKPFISKQSIQWTSTLRYHRNV